MRWLFNCWPWNWPRRRRTYLLLREHGLELSYCYAAVYRCRCGGATYTLKPEVEPADLLSRYRLPKFTPYRMWIENYEARFPCIGDTVCLTCRATYQLRRQEYKGQLEDVLANDTVARLCW